MCYKICKILTYNLPQFLANYRHETKAITPKEPAKGFVRPKLTKIIDPGQIKRAQGLLADYGIRCMGFLMLGGPGETRASVEESLDFADALDFDALKITIGVRIYPNTRMADRPNWIH